MTSAGGDHASRGDGEGRDKTEEELLTEAVGEASDQALGQNQDAVEATLRGAMEQRGLSPGDTEPLAEDITGAAKDS